MQNTLAQLLEHVRLRDPNQPEFHQAVEEVLESLEPFLKDNPKYLDKGLLERILEPERVIQFLYYVPVSEYPDILLTANRNRAYDTPAPADFPEALPSWIEYHKERQPA